MQLQLKAGSRGSGSPGPWSLILIRSINHDTNSCHCTTVTRVVSLLVEYAGRMAMHFAAAAAGTGAGVAAGAAEAAATSSWPISEAVHLQLLLEAVAVAALEQEKTGQTCDATSQALGLFAQATGDVSVPVRRAFVGARGSLVLQVMELILGVVEKQRDGEGWGEARTAEALAPVFASMANCIRGGGRVTKNSKCCLSKGAMARVLRG